VARRCEFDPAFQWLTGLQEVNYHTLAEFRVERRQAAYAYEQARSWNDKWPDV
jgi:hypothetical protein